MNPITDIVEALIAPVTGLIGKFVPDADKAAQLAFEISTMAATQAHDELMAQMDVNKAEASSGSLFVAGWRPAAGWLCVFGMAMNYVIIPMFGPLLSAYTKIVMQPLDMSTMMPLLLGMLGLTGARSLDKIKGVANK